MKSIYNDIFGDTKDKSFVRLHPDQFRYVVKAITGLKNPPPWIVCALGGMSYKPPFQFTFSQTPIKQG